MIRLEMKASPVSVLVATLYALTCSAATVPPPHAKPWSRVADCRLIPNTWNDGDSFHLLRGDARREMIARLYFVDTPEAETAYRDRIDEQAKYFGITREQALQIAHEARDFTRETLSAPFTIWTRWRFALGRSALRRVYCIVVDSKGRDLNELLVEKGLARIYGTKTPLPDGRSSKSYIAHLRQIEARARAGKRGAWEHN
jgi:endonuclease YncB( thermonuclease family)